MKRIVVLSLLLAFSSCKKKVSAEQFTQDSIKEQIERAKQETKESDSIAKTKMTKIEFDESAFDFGKINQGDKVSHIFKFKNTGDKDLIITHAQGSCGCTVPEYPKEAIKPGMGGEIKVTFNSEGKTGDHEKTVTIYANIENKAEEIKIKASIEGDVNKKPSLKH